MSLSTRLNLRSLGTWGLLLVGLGLLARASATEPPTHAHRRPAAREASLRPRALVGSWRAVFDPDPTLHAGTLTFDRDGKAQVAPDGFMPLVGTWTAGLGTLDIVVPDRGTAHLKYELSDQSATLTVHYENGLTQRFTRQLSATGPHP